MLRQSIASLLLKSSLPASLTVDVWSAACILAEMITGQVLFPGHDSILTRSAHCVVKTVYVTITVFNV